MEYFRIKNWDKYQHRDTTRTGRRMTWIKLHTSMLIDHKIAQMTPTEGWLWVSLLLLAGEIGPCLPYDLPWLRRRLPVAKFHGRLDFGFMWRLELIEKVPAGLEEIREEKTQIQSQQAAGSFKESEKISIEVFERIWKSYPRNLQKLGITSKEVAKAKLELKNLSPPDLLLFERAVNTYAKAAEGQEPKFVRSFNRFLDGDFWRNYGETEKSNTKLWAARPVRSAVSDGTPSA